MLELLREALDPSPSPQPAPGDVLAAVLVPFILDGEPSLLFTRRRDDMSRHGGEVSFPGGLPQEEDAGNLLATALRETQEELGIAPSSVDVLGALPPAHTVVSGILIVPFVGALRARPIVTPNPDEIAEVFDTGLARLMEAEAEVMLERDGRKHQTFAYDLGMNIIWGATGRILHSFLQTVAGLERPAT